MADQDRNIDFDRVNTSLCTLFDRFGYSRYKLSKFEEYDLYANNREFWDSAGIITFNDMGGRLMALKPDVTLSIVKNINPPTGSVRKLYYHENVYRTLRPGEPFREIPQAGLEAIGDVDEYCTYEVLKLACKSLELMGREYILEISDISILCEFLESIGIAGDAQSRALTLIGEKNLHELRTLCEREGIGTGDTELLAGLIGLHGSCGEALSAALYILGGRVSPEKLKDFSDIIRTVSERVDGDSIRIDFSIVNDTRYYNGIVFKGYIEGAYKSVLSGGQYDILLTRMHKSGKALGFAIYLDAIESLLISRPEYDVDTLLIYGEEDSLSDIEAVVKRLAGEGEYIMVQRSVPEDLRYRRLVHMNDCK